MFGYITKFFLHLNTFFKHYLLWSIYLLFHDSCWSSMDLIGCCSQYVSKNLVRRFNRKKWTYKILIANMEYASIEGTFKKGTFNYLSHNTQLYWAFIENNLLVINGVFWQYKVCLFISADTLSMSLAFSYVQESLYCSPVQSFFDTSCSTTYPNTNQFGWMQGINLGYSPIFASIKSCC